MANYPHLDRMVAEKRKLDEVDTTIAPLGLHEGEALDDVRAHRKSVEGQHRKWVEQALSNRKLRESVERQIEELRDQAEDINRAIKTLRNACGVEDSEVWYGYDTPFEDEPVERR